MSSGSAVDLSRINLPQQYTYDPGPSEKCSKCGTDLFWHDNWGWHRKIGAMNSYISNLCDKCCLDHMNSVGK